MEDKKLASHPAASPHTDEIEISLVDIVRNLWAGRRLIAACTGAFVVLALASAFIFQKYKSESYYNFAGSFSLGDHFTLGSYDRFINIAKAPERFETYLQATQLDNQPEAENLRALFLSRSGLAEQIKAIHPSLIVGKPNEPKPILGFQIELVGKDAQETPRELTLLSRYLVDVLVYDLYQNSLVSKLNGALVQNEKIENELFHLKIQRPHLVRQQALVEALIEKYARFFEMESRASRAGMVISTEAALGSSPIVQLMNLQMEIAKLDQQVEKLERQQKQIGLYLAFYQQALQSHQDQKTSERFFSDLPQVLQAVFQDQDMVNETVKETYNSLTIEVNQGQNYWQEGQRHLVLPSQTAIPTVRYALVGAVALLAGLFAAMMLVLVRAWWQEAIGANEINTKEAS